MEKIRCIAIDDEPLALRLIEKFVEKTPFLELVALCSDAYEAMEVLQKAHVDAMFVDINMPGIKGMEFVRNLEHHPLVVFTTAYSDYAIEGYDVGAIYYLLKPFGEAEFMKAAMRIKAEHEKNTETGNESGATRSSSQSSGGRSSSAGFNQGKADLKKAGSSQRSNDDVIFVKDGYSMRPIRIGDIRYIESQSEYLRLFLTEDKSIMTLMPLKKIKEMLPPDNFVQPHRSYIVNIKHIEEIRRGSISMDAKTIIPVGANYKESFTAFMSKHSL